MKRKRFDRAAAELVNIKARSTLTIAIREVIESWNGTQAAAAKRLKITQPRVNDLLRGRIDKFSLDALMKLAARAGLTIRVELSAVPLTAPPPKLGAPSLAVNQDRRAAAHAPRKQRRISSQKVKQETRSK
jgi:predicted XRE-type DNA-binding protein